VIGIAVLVWIYAMLVAEVLHRTAVALMGAAAVFVINIFLRFGDFRDLIEYIDMDTILLLMSMMIIVSALSRTGFFEWLASKLVSRFGTNPAMLLLVLSGFTAFISAFIDNVTTVLLITPIVIETFTYLRVDPRPAVLSIIFASNIGGTATLIGDPPNILIGSATGLGFMDFIYNLTPAVTLSFLAFSALILVMFRDWLKGFRGVEAEKIRIKDFPLLERVGMALAIVMGLFFVEDVVGYPPAVAAIIGVGVLLAIAKGSIDIEEAIRDVDWSTLVFFMGMFMVIGGVKGLGVIDFIADSLIGVSTNPAVLAALIMWVSAIVSAFIDNIPFVMAMIPVITSIAATLGINHEPLFWALSLGGCFGGNGTLVGASANIVASGLSEKYGYPISFRSFIRHGFPVMLTTVAVAAAYVLLRYYYLAG